jgi:thiol-disulfide isomerase/thioredoxin
MTVRSFHRLAGGVVALALLGGAAGCTKDPNSVAAQAKAGDQKGYVSGDGAVETIAEGDRGEPVELSGTLLDGSAWDSASARGEVLVLNVWGSWCAPCVAEAPDLQKVWGDLKADSAPVRFMGIDFREDPARGAAFARKAGMTYPSLSDEASGGTLILALQGKAPTVPTTLVLDTEGRIAARVSGPVSPGTLRGLVDDVVAGS